MKDKPNKVNTTLKVVVTGEFYDDEATEETLRYAVEQDLEDAGFEVDDVSILKEQEAVKPIFRENPYTHLPVSYCPKCMEPINQFIVGNPYREVKYCHYCGQKVKWAES